MCQITSWMFYPSFPCILSSLQCSWGYWMGAGAFRTSRLVLKTSRPPLSSGNSRFVLSQPSCWKPQQFEGFESSSMIYLILPLTQDTPENKCNLLEFSDTSRASQSHPQVIPSSLGQNFISKLLSERFEVVFLWPCPDGGTQSQMFVHFKSSSDFALIF